MDKSGVIYMSRPFHSRITRQNRAKNERATPKDPKIEKSETVIPRVFTISFRGKKVYSNRTTRSMGLVGVVEGRHINVSVPVFIYRFVMQIINRCNRDRWRLLNIC